MIFLIKGHAFAGYWTSEAAHEDFIEGLAKLTEVNGDASLKAPKAVPEVGRKVKEPWMFTERHHLGAICKEIQRGGLVAIEATYIPLQLSFAKAVLEGSRHLDNPMKFDGMLDVQTARGKGVTPLAIISQGIVA